MLDLGADPRKVRILPNRVDTRKFAPADSIAPSGAPPIEAGRRILHVGRKSEEKNLDTLIRALARMPQEYGCVFVGRGAGTLALAGLAVSFPIQMFILAIAQVVGIGSASIISRRLGAGDARTAERCAGASFATVALLSLILTVSGLAFLDPLLRLFGATPAVLPYGADYLSVILGGSFFFAFAVSTNCN